MAQKKALVLTNGKIEQLQSGDYLQQADIPQFTNGNAGSLVIGTPVYSSANSTVDKARANAVGTSNVIGLVADSSISAAGTGAVQTDGVLTATTAEWDAVAGTTGGLTRDVIYYLDSATAGKLTSTSPTINPNYSVKVGIGLSTTEMLIQIGYPIKL